MKTIISLVGVLLIILGIVTFAYQGISYTQREKVAEIGDVQVTTQTEKYFPLSPALGGLSLVAGIVLVVAGRVKK